MTLKAQGDITSVASRVDADQLTISTPGQLNLLTATAQETRNHDSRDHDAWFIDGGAKGAKQQTTVYNQFNANSVVIGAGSINPQLSERASLTDLAGQPGMGWINRLQNDQTTPATWARCCASWAPASRSRASPPPWRARAP